MLWDELCFLSPVRMGLMYHLQHTSILFGIFRWRSQRNRLAS